MFVDEAGLTVGTNNEKRMIWTNQKEGKTNNVHSSADPSYRGLCKG